MMRCPAFAMFTHSLSVRLHQRSQNAGQFAPLCRRQVYFLALGEDVQQENWNVSSAVDGDNAIAAALPFAASRDTELTRTTSARNLVTRIGLLRNQADYTLAFIRA